MNGGLSSQATEPEVSAFQASIPSAWQPIETAPRDGAWFLGYRASRYTENTVALWRYDSDGFFVDGGECFFEDFQPTHWVPLPEPPK